MTVIDLNSERKQRAVAKSATEVTLLSGQVADTFGYGAIMNRAMRSAMKEIIDHVANGRLTGNHQIFLKFSTTMPGVIVPPLLLQKYPTEMVVCIQHENTELLISDTGFAMTVGIDGITARVTISYDSIISLVDPSVPFGIGIKQNEPA